MVSFSSLDFILVSFTKNATHPRLESRGTLAFFVKIQGRGAFRLAQKACPVAKLARQTGNVNAPLPREVTFQPWKNYEFMPELLPFFPKRRSHNLELNVFARIG